MMIEVKSYHVGGRWCSAVPLVNRGESFGWRSRNPGMEHPGGAAACVHL